MQSFHDTVRELATFISATKVSVWLQNELWIIPASQSVHIVCVSLVFGSAAMISLRLLGIGGRNGRTVSQLVDTLVPWMYRALTVLLLTGALQTWAEPMRQFVAPVFWAKMIMILCVLTLTIWFARSVRHHAAVYDAAESRPVSARAFALLSLCLWMGIIACGRFIGYTYYFYQ